MSQTEKAPYTSLLFDSEKTSLGKLDMFDRIINLKLTVATSDGKLEEFVIRSDYEIYYPELMSAVASNEYDAFKNPKRCYVRKCQYKPSIRVNYKRVSLSTPVAIDIFIANFFMLTKNGTMIKNFNNTDGKLVKVELAMGYFGQFEPLIQNDVTKGVEIKDLFDFSPEKLKGNGITVITINSVPYVQTEKLPPDAVIHIHGFAGNLYMAQYEDLEATKKKEIKYEDLKKDMVHIDFSTTSTYDSADVKKTVIGLMFDYYVTRMYVRDNELAEDAGIKLRTYNGVKTGATVDIMSESNAEKYGIKVYYTESAVKFALEVDSVVRGKINSTNIHNGDGRAPIASANVIKARVNSNSNGKGSLLVTYAPSTGDIIVYTKQDLISKDSVIRGTALEEVYGEDAVSLYWKDKLPAVYNITTDALCTIVCPFFFFINPFQTFHFKSRYALGGLVAYFGGFTAKEDTFYALWQDISFATVEDVNECSIVCTGSKG